MVKYVALDMGGVLSRIDITQLSEYEKLLRNVYYCRNNLTKLSEIASIHNTSPISLLAEAEKQINNIFLKSCILMDDALNSIEFIQSLSLTPVIWTNNIGALNQWLSQVGIFQYINPINVCNSFFMPSGYNKPHKKFFIHALEQIKADPSEVLFIDDDPKNIDSANDLGILGICYGKNNQLVSTIEKGLNLTKRRQI